MKLDLPSTHKELQKTQQILVQILNRLAKGVDIYREINFHSLLKNTPSTLIHT